jgi:hypothetical protein
MSDYVGKISKELKNKVIIKINETIKNINE